MQRRADHPTEAFELFEDAEIAAGEYWFTRWAADLSSFSSRPLSGGIEISGGDFYLGTRLETGLDARWKVNPHLSLSGDWASAPISTPERNRAMVEINRGTTGTCHSTSRWASR